MPDQEVPGKYTLTVNGNNTINDANMNSSKIVISTVDGKGAVKADTFKLYYENANGKDVELSQSATYSIEKYATQTDEIVANFNTGSNKITDFVKSGEEKNVTLKLKITNDDGTTTVVGTTKVTVNRIHPETVKVSARREGTQGAALKFEAKAESDIVKVYYVVDTTNSQPNVLDFIDSNKNTNVQSMKVENNKFDAILQNIILSNSASTLYKVFFVVENAAGNLSTSVNSTVVPNDTNGKVEGKVTDVSVDDSLTVKWTAPTEGTPRAGYTVTVYNESGKVIGETTTTSNSKTLSSIVTKPGKYTVTVTSNAANDGSSSASEETEPVEFEVTQLAKVTGLQFVVDEEDPTKVLLKWNEYEDKANSAFSSYTINIYKYNTATGDYLTSKETYKNNISKDATEIELKNIASSSTFTAQSNIRYKAEIIANSSKGKVLASEQNATTKDYLKLSITMTPTVKTDTKVELSFTEMATIKALGDEVTYDVEVWSEVESNTAEKHYELTDTRKNVTIDENGKIIVDKLNQGTNYKFVLVVHVDGNEAEGRSALSVEQTTLKTLQALDGLIVIKNSVPAKKEDTLGKVYTDGSTKLWINGEEVLKSDAGKYYDPNKLLDSDYAMNLVNSLNNDDTIVSVTEDKVTIKAASVATNGTARDIKAGNTRVLEIQGNIYQQDLGILASDAKEIILSGNGALFKITDTNAVPVKLSDRVKLVSDDSKATSVTILANATATLNEIDISSSGNLDVSETLTSSKHTLKIKAAKNNTINIINNSEKELEVTFMDGASLGDFQLGKITINSNAKVTIKANSSSKVEADISVTTENGSIDIKDSNLTGAKNVTVSTNKDSVDTVITANTKLKAPINMSSTQVEIMKYTVEQLKALKTSNEKIPGSSLTQSMLSSCTTDDDYQAIVDYFNAFGSKLQAFGKAKVKASKDQNSIIITIPATSEITLVDIEGLK